MSKNILKIENLNLYYDDKQVLKNLNLNIEKNSITAISGPSGIGKSSLLLVLNQMIKEYENASFTGKVYFNDDNKDIDITTLSNKELPNLRKKIVYVSQHPDILPFSIFGNLYFPLKLQKIKKDDAKNLIIEVLKKLADFLAFREQCYEPASFGKQCIPTTQTQRLGYCRFSFNSLSDSPVRHRLSSNPAAHRQPENRGYLAGSDNAAGICPAYHAANAGRHARGTTVYPGLRYAGCPQSTGRKNPHPGARPGHGSAYFGREEPHHERGERQGDRADREHGGHHHQAHQAQLQDAGTALRQIHEADRRHDRGVHAGADRRNRSRSGDDPRPRRREDRRNPRRFRDHLGGHAGMAGGIGRQTYRSAGHYADGRAPGGRRGTRVDKPHPKYP